MNRVESTAEISVEDVPQGVPEDVKSKLAFVRLPRTTVWPGPTGCDTGELPHPLSRSLLEWNKSGLPIPATRPNPPSMKLPPTNPPPTEHSTKPRPTNPAPTKPPRTSSTPTKPPPTGPSLTEPVIPVRNKKKNFIWRLLRRVFRQRWK
ncbi:hypothetical protein B0H19DRAFT_1267846 [Mycena capillaripes]|nr:hypothetical protein B0H19DRAFT_1267846 [Mycena capillaripes]